MIQIKLESGYLTHEDGVLYIRQTGLAKNRIDNIFLRIERDYQKMDLFYTNMHYRENETILGYYSYEGYESTFKPEKVLPEYIEKFEYKVCEPKGFFQNLKCFFGYTKSYMVTKEQFLPRNGLVRLNKEIEFVQNICTTKWFIETKRDNRPIEIYNN